MLDLCRDQRFQRSHGAASVALHHAQGATRLKDLRQSGSAKVFLHRLTELQAVFLNTSGGLTGDDKLSYDIDLGANTSLVASTQTAERAYASISGAASVSVGLRLGAGARLDWLPQETLLYESSSLSRKTTARLAEGASLLLWEMAVLGRPAMGEDPRKFSYTDRRLVARGDRPVWVESLQLDPQSLAEQSNPALLGAARCFATLAFIDPAAGSMQQKVSEVLDPNLCDGVVSAWNGRMILRLAAVDSWQMRVQFARIYPVLRGSPLPRVWQMNGDIL